MTVIISLLSNDPANSMVRVYSEYKGNEQEPICDIWFEDFINWCVPNSEFNAWERNPDKIRYNATKNDLFTHCKQCFA